MVAIVQFGWLSVLATLSIGATEPAARPAVAPVHIAVTELQPEHDGQEVILAFTVAEPYWISGSVPKGQVPSFGIRPVLAESDPRLNVLVSSDLADAMERFGIGATSTNAKGLVIQATGKITRFPAPSDKPDQRPTYQFHIRDWKQFRIVPDPNLRRN